MRADVTPGLLAWRLNLQSIDLTNGEKLDEGRRLALVSSLKARLGDKQVLDSLLDRLARAHDASIYRLVPQAIVLPRDLTDVQGAMQVCREFGVSITFRAAGTSLSGQAVTNGVLIDISRSWQQVEVLEAGKFLRAEPGVRGGHVNRLLARYHRKLGPDPASIQACMLGGIIANNASGMCCGTASNSYQTLRSMQLLFADGFFLDTADPEALKRLRTERPDIDSGLQAIRQRLLSSPDLAARIRKKYRLKNTTGYSLNAFLDFDDSIAILQHLFVGSEGTLGFIAQATLATVEECPHRATALIYFDRLTSAGEAVQPLEELGAAVIEIMDRTAIASVEAMMEDARRMADNPESTQLSSLPATAAALLVEFQESSLELLQERIESATRTLRQWPLAQAFAFSKDSRQREHYWKMRKGLFPSVGAMRQRGTAVIIEDIAVPPSHLADCINDLRSLFSAHGFEDAIIFGHAKDGNLHFVLCNDFSDAAALARYRDLMAGLATLVVSKYDGSLKAEHGTGRNIAPFVKQEWGPELYTIMREVKALFDPEGLLNPGVIISDNPEQHLQDLKTLPPVSELVDQCIECGFCEPVCPSRQLSLTPRQRIALLREGVRQDPSRTTNHQGNPEAGAQSGQATGGNRASINAKLAEDYAYAGIDTCAGDGLCASACPVSIDTGSMMRELRAEGHGSLAKSAALVTARHFDRVIRAIRTGLWFIELLGPFGEKLARVSAQLMSRGSKNLLPPLPANSPPPKSAKAPPRKERNYIADGSRVVIYYRSCLSRLLHEPNAVASAPDLAEATIGTLTATGWQVLLVDDKEAGCCGQVFSSKGFAEAARNTSERLVANLWQRSNGGHIPIICDTSPCSAQLLSLGTHLEGQSLAQYRVLRLFDFPAFMTKHVLPSRSLWPQLKRSVVLHPTCSTIKHGQVKDLVQLAKAFATDVELPLSFGCCGFAGDKGFAVPELTEAATREEAQEVKTYVAAQIAQGHQVRGYSTCHTCAIGMGRATNLPYQSIAQLCYEALSSAPPC